MGTIAYYLIMFFLKITKLKDRFMKKSLEYKLGIFLGTHDVVTSLWLLSIVFLFGAEYYLTTILLTIVFTVITIPESIKGKVFLFSDNNKVEYKNFMSVDWIETNQIAKENRKQNNGNL